MQTAVSPKFTQYLIKMRVVSGVAVSFLLWLLYVHHASADFAGRWMFFAGPQRASERIVRDCALRGIVFHQTSQQRSASHEHAAGLRVLFPFSHQLHLEHATARRHNFSRHGPVRTLYLSILASHVNPFHRRAAMVLTTCDSPVHREPGRQREKERREHQSAARRWERITWLARMERIQRCAPAWTGEK